MTRQLQCLVLFLIHFVLAILLLHFHFPTYLWSSGFCQCLVSLTRKILLLLFACQKKSCIFPLFAKWESYGSNFCSCFQNSTPSRTWLGPRLVGSTISYDVWIQAANPIAFWLGRNVRIWNRCNCVRASGCESNEIQLCLIKVSYGEYVVCGQAKACHWAPVWYGMRKLVDQQYYWRWVKSCLCAYSLEFPQVLVKLRNLVAKKKKKTLLKILVKSYATQVRSPLCSYRSISFKQHLFQTVTSQKRREGFSQNFWSQTIPGNGKISFCHGLVKLYRHP